MKGIPKVICTKCGKETIKAIYIHICVNCKEDYRENTNK